jgi:hypothetical protein
MSREAIYPDTIQEIDPLSEEIEMGETIFSGRRPGKRDWDASIVLKDFGLLPNTDFTSIEVYPRFFSLSI